MDWSATDSRACSVARTLELIGDSWTLLVLRDLFNGLSRFDQLVAHLGIARNILTGRLDRLVAAGLLERVAYQEPGRRVRHEYKLTQMGLDLGVALVALAGWGDRYLSPDGPPVVFEHDACGGRVHAKLVCSAGHVLEKDDPPLSRSGPGARLAG